MPTALLGGWLRRLLSPCLRLVAGFGGRKSTWVRVPMRVPPSAFGLGSRQPFAGYFEGPSCVHVRSIDDIVAFLQTCDYVSDNELFHERDFWQHPSAFEKLRRGDCEDFALWAWRKLAELGIDAEFCVGRVICEDQPEIDCQHAWVVYRVNGTDFLFEPAARTPSRMIRPLAEAMAEYVPYFAANHRFDTSAFVGCALDSHRFSVSRPDPTCAA
jgi:hypothetical protein